METNTQPQEYIPYSKRHNIQDKDLAGLDYLERDIGWDIEVKEFPEVWGFSILSKGWRMHIDKECSNTMSLTHSQKIWSGGRYEIFLDSLRLDIFFRTYRSLLPEIRDLYSKN